VTAATAVHEMVLKFGGGGGNHRIVLSCTCLPGHDPIEARMRFPAGEVIAAWRAWHEERGITL
jgi:hypothetical protein